MDVLIYKRVRGLPIEKYIATANETGVQDYLRARTFQMKALADVMLLEHRFEGHAEILVEHGRVDWYLILSDERGQKAAMSIEYGRAGYVDENGNRVGAMEGLFILHRAADIPRRAKAKVRYRP